MSTKISALPASAGLSLSDIFPVVDDPGGTPVTQKATFTQLQTLLGTGNFVLKAGDTMTGALVHPVGAVGTPSITFTGDTDTGIYSSAPGSLSVSLNGVEKATFNAFSLDLGSSVSLNLNGSTGININSVPAVGILTASLLILTTGVPGTFPVLELSDDGTERILFIDSGSVNICGPSTTLAFFSAAPVGQQTATTLDGIFTALVNYGLLSGGSGMTGQLALPVGSAAAPSLTFTGDLDTGVYHPAANEVGLSSGGTRILTALATGLNLNNITAPGADPTTSSQQWAASGEWQYRSATANEGAGQTNRVHNRGEQVYGSGTDYTLTTSLARVDSGTTDVEITLPTAGTYLVTAQVAAVGAVASVSDVYAVILRNATDSTFINDGALGTLFSSGRLTSTIAEVVTVTSSKLIQLFAVNSTAARGVILSASTHIGYVRLF